MDFNQYCDRLPAMCLHASKKDTITAGERFLTQWIKKIIVYMQEIIRAYKTELKLNNEQSTNCTNHANAARFAWNWGLARRIEAYKEQGVTLNAISLHRELNSLKKTELSWLYDVSKCAPQEALRDLDKAYTNFFEHRARYPRFKTKKGLRQVAVSSTDTLKTPVGVESSGLLNTGASENFLNETGSKHYLGIGVLNG